MRAWPSAVGRADNCSPKRIDCYQVAERSGDVFKLDPAYLVYSLRLLHKAEQPPDFELVLVQDVGWVNTANLTLPAELRRRAPQAI
jgi:hypothetical protein